MRWKYMPCATVHLGWAVSLHCYEFRRHRVLFVVGHQLCVVAMRDQFVPAISRLPGFPIQVPQGDCGNCLDLGDARPYI